MPAWNAKPGQGGIQPLDAIQVGGVNGTPIWRIATGTATIDPANILTVAQGAPTFTLTGAKVNDVVIVVPPQTLDPKSALIGARVTSNDTVTVYINNPSAASSDSASGTWQYIWFKTNE